MEVLYVLAWRWNDKTYSEKHSDYVDAIQRKEYLEAAGKDVSVHIVTHYWTAENQAQAESRFKRS